MIMALGLALLIMILTYRFRIFGQRIGYAFRDRNKILYALAMFSATLLISIFPRLSFSQNVTQARLEIPAKTTYNLDSDTLVVEELILKDSAKINIGKPKSVIKANRIIIGSGCSVSGVGKEGELGKNGKSSPAPVSLCKPPAHGEAGVSGKNGETGKDLYITVSSIKIASPLTIDLHGGNGGDGGKGGNGSHGSNTTAHCKGDGGNGGNGGVGGNGGNGGILTIYYSSTTEVSYLVTRVNLINRGGYRGIGGESGKGGMRGSGPSEKFSKIGLIGKAGTEGKYGTEGRPLFYSIIKADGNAESKTPALSKNK